MISKQSHQKMIELQNEKKELKTIIDLKEAENIVLHQVKEYYETRCR
jgi:hypothetical protein